MPRHIQRYLKSLRHSSNLKVYIFRTENTNACFLRIPAFETSLLVSSLNIIPDAQERKASSAVTPTQTQDDVLCLRIQHRERFAGTNRCLFDVHCPVFGGMQDWQSLAPPPAVSSQTEHTTHQAAPWCHVHHSQRIPLFFPIYTP